MSNAVSVVVTQTAVATTTILTASATQITIGQSVTFTANSGAAIRMGVPTGSITFFDGTTSLGKVSLNAGGAATLSTTALAAGTHSITASYFGDNEDSSSVSNAVSVVVTQSAVVDNDNAYRFRDAGNTGAERDVYGHGCAAVGQQRADRYGYVPGWDDDAGNGATLNASGVATFATTALAVGTQSITASYAGDSKDNSSVSQAVSVVVSQSIVATTTTLSASATQITTGQSVTFTAKVAPQSGKGVPAGSIKFFDGTTSLGKASLNAGGTATLSTTALAAGTHSITASYFGDNEDSSSVSNAVSVVVTQSTGAATTTLPASATQITPGQSVRFTVTVAPQSVRTGAV